MVQGSESKKRLATGLRSLFLGLSALTLLAGLTLWVYRQGQVDAAAQQGAVFTCPMHPSLRAHEAGTCPQCGMALMRAVAKAPAVRPAKVAPALPATTAAVFSAYSALDDALVASDAAKASVAAATLAQKAAADPELSAALASFASDLVGQRKRFSAISNLLIARAAASPQAADGLVVVYCSMAPGRWLQREGSVRNPYFGDEMLTCGDFEGRPSSGGSAP